MIGERGSPTKQSVLNRLNDEEIKGDKNVPDSSDNGQDSGLPDGEYDQV